MKATWNNMVIAESDHTEMVEGNHYFPKDSVKTEYFQDSAMESMCPWKGSAAYYDVVVDGQTNKDAAWHYDEPKPRAENIRGHVAFWRGVAIEE
jgi:uncharacterized protein (DUF427 family)